MKVLIIKRSSLIDMKRNCEDASTRSFINIILLNKFTPPSSTVKNLKLEGYIGLFIDKEKIQQEIDFLTSCLNYHKNTIEYKAIDENIKRKLNIYELIQKEATEIDM